MKIRVSQRILDHAQYLAQGVIQEEFEKRCGWRLVMSACEHIDETGPDFVKTTKILWKRKRESRSWRIAYEMWAVFLDFVTWSLKDPEMREYLKNAEM
jgi:hypothetical protein